MRNIGYKSPKIEGQWEIALQLHKGNTTTQSYTPTEQEVRMQKAAADYAEYVAPNARYLNDTAKGILEDSIGSVQVDFNQLNQNAQSQIASAQQGVQNLANGVLPSSYQTAMEDSIRSGVQNTMGTALNGLAGKGVLNSSVTNQAMNDISKNASNTMAEQYSNNVSTLNGLYGQQAQLANSGITTAAASQEAAQTPALNLWNASLGLNGANTSALSAVAGQGTTTSTQSGSGGVLGALTGLGSAAISAWCFVAGSIVSTINGGKPIEKVNIGDKVLQFKGNNTICEETVIGISECKVETVYRVTAVNDYHIPSSVVCSLSQPLQKEDGEWITVDLLKINTMLRCVGKVTGIYKVGNESVYDLKVSGNNTYIVDDFVAMGASDEELRK